jgi:hypothetical protein
MRKVMKNLAYGFGIFSMIVLIGTCAFNSDKKPPEVKTDSTYIKVLKQEHVKLEAEYQKQIFVLKHEKDSLLKVVSEKKQKLITYQVKSDALENQLAEVLSVSDSAQRYSADLTPLVNSYVEIQHAKDSACVASIVSLETIVANQDSVIFIQNKEKDNLKALKKEQELQAQNLTEQLNVAYKQQRRSAIKSKLLSGAVIILTGFASALLINQSLK